MIDFGFLANRVNRKLTRRRREQAFAAMREPFIHEAWQGRRFCLHPGEYIDREIFVEGIFEIYELRTATRFAGGALIDIGANIGNHAIFLAPWFREVHCFEPNPAIADRLEQNAALNGFAFHIHRVGLGAADADLPFTPDDSGNQGRGSFAATGSDSALVLPVRRGDDLLGGVDDIALIKIDVEGFELETLRGLQHTLARSRAPVIFEFDARSNSFDELRSLLPGYTIEEIDARGHIRPLREEPRIYNALIARVA